MGRYQPVRLVAKDLQFFGKQKRRVDLVVSSASSPRGERATGQKVSRVQIEPIGWRVRKYNLALYVKTRILLFKVVEGALSV